MSPHRPAVGCGRHRQEHHDEDRLSMPCPSWTRPEIHAEINLTKQLSQAVCLSSVGVRMLCDCGVEWLGWRSAAVYKRGVWCPGRLTSTGCTGKSDTNHNAIITPVSYLSSLFIAKQDRYHPELKYNKRHCSILH